MKIKTNKINDSLLELNITCIWENIEGDYFKEQNKLLANVNQKGARKGKLIGIQRELFIKNNKDSINSNFVDFQHQASSFKFLNI